MKPKKLLKLAAKYGSGCPKDIERHLCRGCPMFDSEAAKVYDYQKATRVCRQVDELVDLAYKLARGE